MKRLVKLAVVLFIVVGCVVFAAALAGGLMEDNAFTSEVVGQGH